YKRGMNIAAANLLTTSMPVFLNATSWSNFLSLFVRFLRERTPSSFNEWQTSAKLIYSYLEQSEPESAYFIAPAFLMSDPSELLQGLGDHELDPLVPAYYVIVNHWGESIGEAYEIVADQSKVLAQERARLLTLSDPNVKPVRAGYDRRKMDLPLKVSEIIGVDSTAYRQVQFADVLCGAIANGAKAQTKGALRSGTFAHCVLELCYSKGLIIDALWPNHKVDPADLETDDTPGPGDVDLPTYIAMILKRDPSTKK